MGGKATKEIQKLENTTTQEIISTADKADFRNESKSTGSGSFESSFDEISDFEDFEFDVSDAEEAQENLPSYMDILDTVL